ncbi:hypothetical protein NUSPORA_02931 [Nucleospora cyclopteri]
MLLNPDKPFSVFSNKGKLSQCDNALTAALNASLSVGMSSKEGTVLMSHKKLPALAVKHEYNKVFSVCESIGMTYSGLQPDFRKQLAMAQLICQEYFDVYNKYPSLDVFVEEFSLTLQENSQKGGKRPYGTFLLVCGAIRNISSLYQVDPSGSFKKVQSVSAGAEYEAARSFLSKRMGVLDDNITTCYNCIKEHSGMEIKGEDISVGVFKEGKFKVYSLSEINEIIE